MSCGIGGSRAIRSTVRIKTIASHGAGEMAEWLKAHAWKACLLERVEINLTKRVQTPHGWRYCTVALSANGRVKPDVVVVNDKQETHKEGAYYLEWREGSTRVRLSVGKDPADASARRQRKEAELNAVNNGVAVVPDGQKGTDR